jgi:hypothetical protein
LKGKTMAVRIASGKLLCLVFAVLLSGCESKEPVEKPSKDTSDEFRRSVDIVAEPYLLDTGLLSRSISFENPTGAPGQGGKAASKLGVGRKGKPAITLKAGQTAQLCDIKGPGTIRHIWMTTSNNPLNLRSLVFRAWWDGQEHPSIECPIGDFMGFAHGKVMPYDSAAHSLGKNAGMNIWLPLPFVKRAKITLSNEGKENVPLFYQIDYTAGDKHPDDVGRMHVLFRRDNPTTEKQDFVMLPQRKNKGRFMGAIIGVRNMHPGQWWGEGEIKIYMDGDTDFPTICGTGSEDYVCLSYGMQQTPYLYNGCSLTIPSRGEKNVASQFNKSPGRTAWLRQRTTGRLPRSGMSRFQANHCRKCPTIKHEQLTSGRINRIGLLYDEQDFKNHTQASLVLFLFVCGLRFLYFASCQAGPASLF